MTRVEMEASVAYSSILLLMDIQIEEELGVRKCGTLSLPPFGSYKVIWILW